jgi:hypothetical protein
VQHVRVAALRYLALIPNVVRYDAIHPQRARVLRELFKALDDPKKAVRRHAVDARYVPAFTVLCRYTDDYGAAQVCMVSIDRSALAYVIDYFVALGTRRRLEQMRILACRLNPAIAVDGPRSASGNESHS